jgi:hypothetical protein
MAPTETLGEQHAATLDRLLSGRPVPFTLLTSATPASRRREALSQLARGELAMVVGTHALIEPDVEFGRSPSVSSTSSTGSGCGSARRWTGRVRMERHRTPSI